MTESQQYKKKIQWRRDTIEDWSNSNPLLLDGEIVIVTMEDGSVRLKVGNGRDVFNILPFQDDILRKLIDAKVNKVDGKVLSTNDFTDYDKKTLDDLSALKAFRAMTVGDVTLAAEDVEEVLRIVAGDNITLHVDPETHVITIASAYPTYPEATPTNTGLMSADDKRKIDNVEDGANNYQHPTNAGNKHIPAGGSRGQILQWASNGTAVWGTPSVDASQVVGKLSIDQIPQGALERMIIVANDAARFALTESNAQNGDVVKVEDTGSMYYIVDQTKLSSTDGYQAFSSGTASAVAWSNITDKPSAFPPVEHEHNYAGSITPSGAAISAVSDEAGQNIAKTYIKDINPSRTGIEFTKGDGTKQTVEIVSGGGGGSEGDIPNAAIDATCTDDGNGNITMSSYGYLPTVVPVETEGGVRLDITDVNGIRSTEIMHGEAPKRGIDYWTEDDKDEIKAYVDETILGGEW